MIHTTLKRADNGISGKERKRKEKIEKNWNSDIKQYSDQTPSQLQSVVVTERVLGQGLNPLDLMNGYLNFAVVN